jgi:hypothetical protein
LTLFPDKVTKGFSMYSSPEMPMPLPPIGNTTRQTSLLWLAVAKILFFGWVFILANPGLEAADLDLSSSLQSSILALDSAKQTALREVEGLSAETGEIVDYKDFIVYLNTRIVSYCMALAEQGGSDALKGLPCPAGPMGAGLAGTPNVSGAEVFFTTGEDKSDNRTQAEKTAELDKDFLSTLGDFDEMLLKEEGKVAERVPSQREPTANSKLSEAGSKSVSTGASMTGSNDSEGTKEGETASAGHEGPFGGEEGQDDRSGTIAGAKSGGGPGAGNVTNSAYGHPEGTLPPPKDDDIVARQLREAAEKEPDPELKKKLWEEYWKYKGKNKTGGA